MSGQYVDLTERLSEAPDLRDLSDFRRKQLRESSSCVGCGSHEPARIEGRTCSDCTAYPTCGLCGRWVGDGSGWLPGYVNALDGQGDDIKVCTFCYGEAT
jgi:hypothetical protein